MGNVKIRLHNSSTIFLTILLLGVLLQGCAPKTIINASYDGDLALAEELIREGADVNNRYSGITPLHNAAMNGHLEVVKLLIEKGADVNATSNTYGVTPLHNAAANGHIDIVKILIENGATSNTYGATSNTYGVTPLHNAAANGHIDIVKILIENGADMHIVAQSKYKGITPLDNATINGHDDIVKFLMDNGAKRNHVDTDEPWSTSRFCKAVRRLEKGMSANEIKNLLGAPVLRFFGAASCRLAKQGGITYEDKLFNGLIYTITFDEDCRLETWDFRCDNRL